MRRKVAAAGVVMLLLCLSACAATPRAQLRTAADTYATTVRLLAEARGAGLIDDEQAARIEEYRLAARAALDAWREAVAGGEDQDAAARSFDESMLALRTELAKAQGKDRGDGTD